MLFRLPDGNSAEAVRVALAETVQQLPEHLWQSLTWDQGKEMAQHAQFTIDTGVQVYFCDPNRPGREDQTRTPTVSCVSTSPKAPTWRLSPSRISTSQPTNSTAGLDKPSTG